MTIIKNLLESSEKKVINRVNEANMRKRFKEELDSPNIAYVAGIMTALDIIVSNNISSAEVQNILGLSARDKAIWDKYLRYKGEAKDSSTFEYEETTTGGEEPTW